MTDIPWKCERLDTSKSSPTNGKRCVTPEGLFPDVVCLELWSTPGFQAILPHNFGSLDMLPDYYMLGTKDPG